MSEAKNPHQEYYQRVKAEKAATYIEAHISPDVLAKFTDTSWAWLAERIKAPQLENPETRALVHQILAERAALRKQL